MLNNYLCEPGPWTPPGARYCRSGSERTLRCLLTWPCWAVTSHNIDQSDQSSRSLRPGTQCNQNYSWKHQANRYILKIPANESVTMKYLTIILFKLVEKNTTSNDDFVFLCFTTPLKKKEEHVLLMSFDVEVFVKLHLHGLCGRYQYGPHAVHVVRVGCRVVGRHDVCLGNVVSQPYTLATLHVNFTERQPETDRWACAVGHELHIQSITSGFHGSRTLVSTVTAVCTGAHWRRISIVSVQQL